MFLLLCEIWDLKLLIVWEQFDEDEKLVFPLLSKMLTNIDARLCTQNTHANYHQEPRRWHKSKMLMNQVLQRGQQIHRHVLMNILILSLPQTHQRWFLNIQYVCIRTPWHALNLSVHYPFHSAASEFVWRGTHLTLSCLPANILTHIASPAYGSLLFTENNP